MALKARLLSSSPVLALALLSAQAVQTRLEGLVVSQCDKSTTFSSLYPLIHRRGDNGVLTQDVDFGEEPINNT